MHLPRGHGQAEKTIIKNVTKPDSRLLDSGRPERPFDVAFAQPTRQSSTYLPKIAQTKRYEGFGFEFGVENDKLRREFMQAYHACISFIDAQIGVVLDALKRSGQWDDTIVVLTSDHGYLLGENFMWAKVMLFETCDRVPLVIRVPKSIENAGTTFGSSSEGLVELVDLFPTFAQLCDVTPPSELQGRSLTAMLSDPTSNGKEIVYTVVTRGKELGKAIRTQRYRYTLWHTEEELYDLAADPHEQTNLANSPKHAKTLEEMQTNLTNAEARAVSRRR